ncbi:MAG TPA: dimethylmenaquinone methyltransferase [Elusimicrobia bacterium]|nr:MAG: dimethylmenaquinone methyltransferase [Elusimicrobia bacterium RIFOXYA12_FULL_49_49]OGS09399.1 MAG: dimethylmenaquinone methyltransferase [Elusimicrobia bacterium RIFOXYA1_FULL_47_7]OGS11181.1 MAG: dimethylmenaquinone methyltransferase [Elusimicrobia bacterium RIFOXYB1_FULL_48_9]OGS15015.1 MAG: dimethylmenaquinone methyltransferase [Elusimicrobia bacterium RIFOXYA2_FULL_47_53]OGS26160.1 MAG: dimethylmenaquinone methyltransferase [Elusimicrobia bacterium RIFOXYB12_FULL_50_12]OGS29359.1 
MGPILDSDFRRAFQSPNVIIQRSGIQEGMKVVEIGCGSGAFTTYVARAIGPKGTTFAVDIQQKMLKQLEAKLKKRENRDIENVKIYNHSAYHLPFEDESMDLVFFVSVLQQIPDINKALSESRRVLKTGGTLAVTETLWDPYYPICATTIKQGIAAGFSLSKLDGNFWHYTARFKK